MEDTAVAGARLASVGTRPALPIIEVRPAAERSRLLVPIQKVTEEASHARALRTQQEPARSQRSAPESQAAACLRARLALTQGGRYRDTVEERRHQCAREGRPSQSHSRPAP